MEEKKNRYRENRAELLALSRAAKMAVSSGQFDTINEALIDLYTTAEHNDFRTFWEWKDAGYSIKKGVTAFKVWGRPKKAQKQEPKDANDEFKYWPICYLFSNAQVQVSAKPNKERRAA